MKNKLEKNEACEYCGKLLEAKYRSKRFCNDKCRVYFNRENKSRSTLGITLPDPAKEGAVSLSLLYSETPKNRTNPALEDFYPGRKAGESILDYKVRLIEEKEKKQ